MMTAAQILLVLLLLQAGANAQQNKANLEEFELKASAIIEQAKSQVMILTNQLMTNATIITNSAEGNASQLLGNLYNEISKGIADAQLKASQVEPKQKMMTGRFELFKIELELKKKH